MLILNTCNFQKMLSNLTCFLIYSLTCVLENFVKLADYIYDGVVGAVFRVVTFFNKALRQI